MSAKLERLLNLTALLLDTERPLRIDQIGKVIEGYPPEPSSFRRAFERDKDDLREMGIPVRVVELDPGDRTIVGYTIPADQYYLPDPGLEADELAALRLAVGAVRSEGIAAGETLRKLGATSPDDGPALASVPTPPEIGQLHAAIAEHRIVEFTYHDQRRTVEPRRLDYQRGRWYLTGFDHLRGERRSFRVDRLVGPLTSGEPGAFEAEGTFGSIRFDAWRYGDDEPVVARLRIDAAQAPLSRDLIGDDATWTDEPDGSATVEMTVANRHAFRSFVLGLLDHAVVLHPPELRDDLVAWLRTVREAAS